jgi:hypothetical protein
MEVEDLDCQIYSHLQSSQKASDPSHLKVSISTLLRLLQNISDHPSEAKFRSIKRSNKAIQSKLLSVQGISEILTLVGFTAQDTDTLTLSSTQNIETAMVILQAFECELAESLKTEEEKEHERRQQEIRKKAQEKEEHKKRLLEGARLDRQETNTKLMPTQDSVAINRGPGTAKTFKDIGVDLNVQKKG